MDVVSIQHVALTIPKDKAAEAKRFFGEVLALEEMPRPGSLSEAGRDGIWYHISGEQELHIQLRDDPEWSASASDGHPAFIVDGLDELHARLEVAGLDIEEAIPIAGRKRFFARDPGGNRIEFLSFEKE